MYIPMITVQQTSIPLYCIRRERATLTVRLPRLGGREGGGGVGGG